MQSKLGQQGKKWPLIKGPTGSGKTVLASQLAEALGLPFYALNLSEGLGETSVWGKETARGFVPGPGDKVAKHGGVFLIDELDNANDNMATSLNTLFTTRVGEMVCNPFSGETYPLHKDAYFIAATNTIGKGGDGAHSSRNKLDAATLNRFQFFELDYDLDLERSLCPDTKLLEILWAARVALKEKGSKDTVSTRDIDACASQVAAGYPIEKALACLARRMDAANRDLFKAKGGK
jgi:MoxR-like ATPase